MDEKEKLKTILVSKMREKKLDIKEYRERLKAEIKEISIQGEFEYFLELYESGKKFSKNEHNLLTPYLLGIVDDFDIKNLASYIYGEFPDIDIDYLPIVRDYLKNEWAPKTFGVEKVCSIGNYTTFGVKSALIDMAKVHGLDRDEIIRITTKMPAKDADGKDLSWEKALASSKEAIAYCEAHPEVAKAAEKLVGRNRGKGKHAAGLIISKSRIDELVPLITDTDGTPISAWPEGLHTQDLQPVGLVKFDLLVITNLMQIAVCTNFIKQRHGVESICALPGGSNWSDTSYLNDAKSIEIANRGDLRCIFQFDSDGIREMAKKGGVTDFDDLVAYSALYRPGTMQSGTHEQYIKRKNGEEYAIHPVMAPILGNSYAVMVYQEQIMKILNVVGGIPMRDCYKALKAISKKRGDIFEKYHKKFVINGAKKLEWDVESVEVLWEQIAAFSGYGFNKSHAVSYTYTTCRLLWLKSHYPLEFFAAVLSCEDDADKIREYRAEAERFGIKVNPVDVNKSGVGFSIKDEEIYVGFSNIKGVGKDMAQKIVNCQPYASFEDFLIRFGTEADVVKALIGLRVFKESDPITLYEFYEYVKDELKKKKGRYDRNIISREKLAREMCKIFEPEKTDDQITQVDLLYAHQFLVQVPMADLTEDTDFNAADAIAIIKKYRSCVGKYDEKAQKDPQFSLKDFIPKGIKIDEKLLELYEGDPSQAEKKFYGFSWTHILQKSPDYKGNMTFEELARQDVPNGPVEGWIIERPKQTKSKSSENHYYMFKLQDENYQEEQIIIWPDDYELYKEDLDYWESDRGKGNLVRVRLEPPKKYKRYKFQPISWQERKFGPKKEKEHDPRLLVLEKPVIETTSRKEIVSKVHELMVGDL